MRTFVTLGSAVYWAVIIAVSLWVYRDLAGVGLAIRDSFTAALGKALGQ
jgi:hypothetical protein